MFFDRLQFTILLSVGVMWDSYLNFFKYVIKYMKHLEVQSKKFKDMVADKNKK